MFRTCFFLLFSFLCFIEANGQNKDKDRAIVHMHDGSVYLGDILNENTDSISLKIFTNDIIHVDKRITKKILSTKDRVMIYDNGKYHFKKGFFWGMHFGFNLDEQRPSSHLAFIFGQRINQRFSLFGGFGPEFNSALVGGFNFDTQFTALYAGGRYYFTSDKKRFFLYSRVGMGFADSGDNITNDHTNGLQMQNGIGLHFASKRKSRFVLQLAHHYQKTEGVEFFTDTFGNEIKTEFDILISRIILKLGFDIN